MSTLVDWLLGLKDLRLGNEGVELGFATELEAWQWAGAAVLCAGLAVWSYRRIEGPVWARGVLGAARGLLLLTLVVLACGPRLQRANETIERDWVVMLVDRSGSMRIPDAPGREGEARRTREEQLRGALAERRAMFEELAAERKVLWLGFDSGAFDLQAGAAGGVSAGGLPVALETPSGTRTDLGQALEQALQRAAARPVSGVVVLSDGRSSDAPSRGVLRRLAAEKVPVIAVPLGSADPLADVAVRSAAGPGVAFVDDVAPVDVVVEHIGALPRGGGSATARVQLIDSATGDVLDEKRIEWKGGVESAGGERGAAEVRTERVTLTATPGVAGKAQWTVRVIPEGGIGGSGAAGAREDLVSENNQTTVNIELVDRPLRVLYVDAYPRWEYRFLQAILTREKTLASTAMLLATGRRSIQEGNTPMDSLPLSPGEWERIDAIVLGDVQPEVFTGEQLRQIRQRVAVGGAGLLWIAGEGATPGAWRGTVLADLLPINMEAPETLRVWDRDVVMAPTPVADRLGVLRLLRIPVDESWWPTAVSDPRSGWSRLRWAQRLDRALLKPAAEVLATARTAMGDDEAPLVVSMRYGAGRVIYVGTDEIWRWRYGRGEDLPERFWLQMVRLLGRESVGRAGKPAIITATPTRAEVGQAVRVRAELLDQALAEGSGSVLQVRVTRVGDLGEGPGERGSEGEAAADLTLRAVGDGRRGGAGEEDGRPTYQGTWAPGRRGVYRLEVIDPLLRGVERVATEVEVWLADDELRRPETDHPLLAQLARESGGSVLAAEELGRLPELLPRREVRITLAPDEHTLWDRPLALIVILLLVTVEWAGRRLIRLA
ncbi:MAG: hypothetical protein AB7K52_00950 [Phycisphaerales bacterium]